MSKNAGNIVLEAKNVVYYYKANKGKKVLDDISYGFEIGKMYAILGPSGSGKTTFLSLLAGLDSPTDGGIYYEGVNIRKKGLHNYRKKNMSLVFQNYNLIDSFTVLQNVKSALLIRIPQMDEKEADRKALEYIRKVGLEKQAKKKASHLSSGQKQRLSIARALAKETEIIVADEPTGNLDSCTSQDVMGLLKTTSTKFSQTIVMITHNEEIAQLADRIIRIEDGRIVTGKAGEAL